MPGGKGGPPKGSPKPPGSGRQKGQLNKRTLARIEEIQRIVDAGLTPLRVMNENMVFWHEQAITLGEQLREFVAKMKEAPPDDGGQSLEQAMKLMRMFFAARENSQKCAVDAAPYVHAKLSAITVDDKQARQISVVGGLPDA